MSRVEERVSIFFKELQELCKKHDLYIDDRSCSCCGPTQLVNGEGKEVSKFQPSFFIEDGYSLGDE